MSGNEPQPQPTTNNFDEPSTDTSYHNTHCNNCYNLKQCTKEQKQLNRNSAEAGAAHKNRIVVDNCPIITCSKRSCHQRFHSCKLKEHEELCPGQRIPCINQYYGCPFKMERRALGGHLIKCPASIVVCTIEWNRKPLPPWKDKKFHQEQDSTHIDIAALNRDKRTVSEFYSNTPLSLRSVLKTQRFKHPIMPLGVSGNRIPNCILDQCQLEKVANDGIELGLEEDEIDSFSSCCNSRFSSPTLEDYGSPYSPPGLQQSVCSKLKEMKIEGHEPNHNSEVTNSNHNSRKEKDVDLSLIVDVITKHSGRHTDWYTFMCSREFRRDEYSSHFKNVHTEIITQLNGWLFRRCPMNIYGCGFGVSRMFPIKRFYEVNYNAVVDSFSYKRRELEVPDPQESPDFSTLPYEVLVRLTRYLDPLSLNALSLTSTVFREICSFIVLERGMVVFDWERDPETGKWTIAGKKWIFSTSFSPINRWEFDQVGIISQHMEQCTFYQSTRNIQQEPFRYPVEEKDL